MHFVFIWHVLGKNRYYYKNYSSGTWCGNFCVCQFQNLTRDGWSPVYIAVYGTFLAFMVLRTFPIISSVESKTHFIHPLCMIITTQWPKWWWWFHTMKFQNSNNSPLSLRTSLQGLWKLQNSKNVQFHPDRNGILVITDVLQNSSLTWYNMEDWWAADCWQTRWCWDVTECLRLQAEARHQASLAA